MGGQIALRYLLSDEGGKTFDKAILRSPLLRLPELLPLIEFIEHPIFKFINKLKIDWFNSGDDCILTKSALMLESCKRLR